MTDSTTIDTTEKWDQFIYWAKKFYALPQFDYWERDYKLTIGINLQQAKQAHHDNADDWFAQLKRAFGNPNNLTNWRQHDVFLKWAQSNPDAAREALKAIWNDDLKVESRFDSFELAVPKEARPTSITLTSFLHMANGVTEYPIYRISSVADAYRYVSHTLQSETSKPTTGERYRQFLNFLDLFGEESTKRGLEHRDRLDLQGLIWCLTTKTAPEGLSHDETNAFGAFVGRSQSAPIISDTSQPVENVERIAVLRALEQFDAELRDTPEWNGWEDRHNYRYAVLYGDRRYSVKQVYSLATGLPVAEFISTQARSYLGNQGF